MPLAAGSKLGPYEILAPIGAGGMGEVYKARDTRLDRTVAIKISKQEFSARFEREARTIASLNHPNICQLYDVGPNYLVMELVDGEPLKGALPLDKALTYAGQILEALDAAHKKGIVHRDLKPGNILVTRQGIKLLDFGLAKALAPLKEADATLTTALSSQGQILGTLQYMAPEQLQGKEADARSDLFALGCIMVEMLTGKRPFDGASAASVIAAILEREAPSVATVAPTALDRVVRRSLEKDPDQRWQTARDLRTALELASEPQTRERPIRRRPLPWIISTAALAVLVLIALWSLWRQATPDERPVHFYLTPPPGTEFVLGAGGGSAISPNGRTIAFVASSGGIPKLWVRSMDSLAARELSGTDGAQFPFWSPDSRLLGFFASGKLKRIEASGGVPVGIADAPTARGGSWNSEGTIIFVPRSIGGVQRVTASGGTPVPVTSLDAAMHESSHRWPQFLPGSHQFLYFSLNSDPGLSGIFLCSLDRPSERLRVSDTLAGGGYAPPHGQHPGCLLWFREGALVARPFDPKAARFTGEAVPLPETGKATFVSGIYYAGFSASNDGVVLFGTGSESYRLTWFDREGKVIGTVGQADRYGSLRISPDGNRVAVAVGSPSGGRDLATIDFSRGVQTRLSSGGMIVVPIWSSDGRRLVYTPINGPSIFELSANGAGEQETILRSSHPLYPDDWSPDGRLLLYEELSLDNHLNLWLLPRTSSEPGGGKPIRYLTTSSNQSNAQFSPDGRWIAYTSDESGQGQEIYVQSFPASAEAKWQVSNGGGNFARWGRDGKELFYRALNGRLMAVSVRSGLRGLDFGTQKPLLRITEPSGPHTYPYDVALDGRILALTPATEGSSNTLTVIINWQAGIHADSK